MADWTDAGPLSGFPEGELTMVELGRQEVVILRQNENVFAMRNVCPHAAAKICSGRLVHRIVANLPGPRAGEIEDDLPLVACPWHGWEFDPRDGSSLADPRMRLKVWPARVDASRVLVEI